MNSDELLIPQQFSSSAMRIFGPIDRGDGEEWDCWGMGGTCLDDIEVRPHDLTQLQLKSSGFDDVTILELYGSHLNQRLLEFAHEGSKANFESR